MQQLKFRYSQYSHDIWRTVQDARLELRDPVRDFPPCLSVALLAVEGGAAQSPLLVPLLVEKCGSVLRSCTHTYFDNMF